MQEQEICNFVKKHLQEFRKGVGDPVRPGPITQRLVGQGPCALPGVREKSGSGRRGNRRSAASGGRSELISRKCPDWRPQQWPGIGWHDGGQPPAPTKAYLVVHRGYKRRGGVKNPPVTASPCQPPLGKGAEEDGRKQRVFDAIKPPPGAGALKGVCGEGGLR